MSEIKKLIERLCPDGVEYKKLSDLAEVGTGSSNKQDSTDDGKYPFFVRSKFIERHNDYEYDEEAIIIPGEGGIGDIFHYINGKYALHQRVYRIHFTTNLVNAKFAYYYLRNSFKKYIMGKAVSATVTSIRKPMIQNFEIPVPPIEVQRKIVEILDNFTELEVELEARKKQYEYYRNQLLTFDLPDGKAGKVKGARFDVKWMTLGEIGEIIKGSGIQKSDFVEDGYPCIHYGQLHTYFGTFADKNKSYIKKELYDRCKKAVYGDLIIASTSEDVEACCKATAWLGGEVAISGDAHIFHHNQDPKYVSYFFQTDDFATQKRKYASGVKVVRVSSDNLAKITIPIPPLVEQQRIVSILDRFEALTTDLQSGLPAEIEARRKQYEYYREELLTFKRI